jgi:hypothetical protein
MPLTRPKIWDLDTNVEYFMDPITVLHQGSTQANVDVGFLFNRANGLVSNVAVYWSESANTFVTAFTNNSGVTNSNIVATGYANLTIGSLLSINGNIYLNGTAGIPGQYISSTASGTAWASSAFNGGVIANTLYPSGNLTLNLGTTSAFWANTYTGNVILSNNILWANGAVFSSGTGSGSVGYSPSANVAIYANVTPYTTNQTFYPVFSNITTAGNSVYGVSSSLSYNPGTSTLSATNLSGTLNTAAQTNITSVGTLTSLAVGAVTSSGTVIAATVTAATIGNSGAVLTGSTGTFTSWANVTGTANSTSTSTGALVVAGGAGIAGNLYVGGNISASNFLGNIFFGPTPTATYYTQAPLNLTNSLAGGIKTQLNLINTGGGAGAGAGIDFYTYTSVAGSTYPEARIAVVDDGNYSNYITFQTKIPGNTGANALAERLKIDSAGNLVIPTTTTSTSTTTGALVVAGGVGVAGALYTGSVVSATITATTVNAATIGNSGASLVGTLSAVNVSGTVATANVSLYNSVTAYTTNQTFYPQFSNIATTGNSVTGVATNLSFNPATGNLTVTGNVLTNNYLYANGVSILTGVTYNYSNTNVAAYLTTASINTTGTVSATAINGTLGTASQPNITSLDGLTSFGTAGVTTTAQGNLSIAGNLTVTGNSVSIGATTLSITDPIININTPQDLTPLTVPTTSDIGLKFHYYDTADSSGFSGRTVADGYFTYWAKGTDTANVFVGTQLGTFKGGAAWFNNTTAATGTTSSTAGALYVAGGAGIAGNLYVGNLNSGSGSITTTGTVSATNLAGTLSAVNVSGTVTTANVSLYEQVTALTTNQTFYLMFGNINTTGNTISGVATNLSFNPSTGNLVTSTISTTGNIFVGALGAIGIGTATPDSELTILGTPQTVSYPITGVNAALGTDLHIVGADGANPTRITQDTFGTGGYVAFTGRSGRGTAASPTQTQSGDTLTQLTARGFSSGSLGFGTASTGRVDIVAAENFTDTSRATNVQIFATATGNITPTVVATFSNTAVTTTTSVQVPYGRSNAPVDISRISLAHALIA